MSYAGKRVVYKFCSHTVGKINLESKRLRGSILNDQNDIFEMDAFLFADDDQRAAHEYLKLKTSADWRSISFSKSYDNPLLWGHYAESNRGMCLGFEFGLEGALQDVTYVDSRGLLNFRDAPPKGHPDHVAFYVRLFATKHAGWSYEDETRAIFVPSPKNLDGVDGYEPFNKDMKLVEVILGPRCSEVPRDFRAWLDRIGLGSVELKLASPSPHDFKIVASSYTP